MATNLSTQADYLAILRSAIWSKHNCGATHVQTVPVHVKLEGEAVWNGEVEVFDVIFHPAAKRAYAWAQDDGTYSAKPRLTVVLELPPVRDALTAVQASIVTGAQSPRPDR